MSASKSYRLVKTALAVLACVFLCSFLAQPAQAKDPSKYNPNLDQEFSPEEDDSDIPKTKAPVAGYGEYPMSHYHLDIYKPKKDKDNSNSKKHAPGGFQKAALWIMHPKLMTKTEAKSTGSSLMTSVEMFFVNLIWRGYRWITHAGIAVLTQAFTFDLVHHMLGKVGNVIHELGTGIKFLMSFMLFLAACFLIFKFGQGQFRSVIGSLLIAALFAAGFSWYLDHSTDVMRILNKNTNRVSNAVLNSASYSINEGEAKKATGENEKKRKANDHNEYLGVSKMHNVMHDLFIVKPYELMQYGTTDLAVIGGANPGHVDADHPTQEEAKAQKGDKKDGRDHIRAILKHEPGSKKRDQAVQDQGDHSIMWPGFISQRMSIALMIWIPSLFVVPILVILAVLEQVYSLMFLTYAVVGVFTIFMAIFPPWQSFVRGWIKNVLSTLAMKIGLAMMLVLMFTFTNIAYQLANGTLSYGYGATMFLIIIIFVTIFAFRKRIFGRDTIERHKSKVGRGAQVAGALALGAATGGAGAGAASAATKGGASAAAKGASQTGARRMTEGRLGQAGRMMGGKAGQHAQATQGVLNWRRQRKEEKAPIKEHKAQQKDVASQVRQQEKTQRSEEKRRKQQEKRDQKPGGKGDGEGILHNRRSGQKSRADQTTPNDQPSDAIRRKKTTNKDHGVIHGPSATMKQMRTRDVASPIRPAGYQPPNVDYQGLTIRHDKGKSKETDNDTNPGDLRRKHQNNEDGQGVLHKKDQKDEEEDVEGDDPS